MADPAPFVVTLGFDPATFGRLDALRRRYFPPDRNVVPAHLSLFHHLPSEQADAIDSALHQAASRSAPIPLSFAGLLKMGSGFALTVEAPGPGLIHASLSLQFRPWLTPQDRQRLHPHVTIMNKADRLAAALALAEFRESWEPFSGLGDALLLWRYRGGPWEWVARYDFTGSTP